MEMLPFSPGFQRSVFEDYSAAGPAQRVHGEMGVTHGEVVGFINFLRKTKQKTPTFQFYCLVKKGCFFEFIMGS